jgi:hypothetical protein
MVVGVPRALAITGPADVVGLAPPPAGGRSHAQAPRPRRAREARNATALGTSALTSEGMTRYVKGASRMRGYKFLIEVEGLDHPVWQAGYGHTEVECRRDAEARVEETYGSRAVTTWVQRRLDPEDLPCTVSEQASRRADAEPQPIKDELYWHMEVDAWLAQLGADKRMGRIADIDGNPTDI